MFITNGMSIIDCLTFYGSVEMNYHSSETLGHYTWWPQSGTSKPLEIKMLEVQYIMDGLLVW